MEESDLPTLIPQAVFNNLIAKKQVDNQQVTFHVMQRDCVENLVRNILNMSFLYSNGKFRPEIREKYLQTNPILASFYLNHSPMELVSNESDVGKDWLEKTLGLESYGVKYAQGNREVLTGIDNILALMEGLMPDFNQPGLTRDFKLTKLCEYLSSKSLELRPPSANSILFNHQDFAITFILNDFKPKKKRQKLKIYVNTEHVGIRHGNQFSI